ncbi:hypothetical protein D3C87_1255600 [compost metagenome]
MKNVLNLVSFSLVSFAFASAMAVGSTPNSAPNPDGNDTRYDHFFQVDETSGIIRTQSQDAFLNPLEAGEELFAEHTEWTQELKATLISLLSFELHNENFGDVNERYQRAKHFGSWVRDGRSNSCYNTRGKVLARDSRIPVGNAGSGCSVATGSWADPYAGGNYSSAADIEIDHFVPLKNAYVSGAFRWDYKKRCLYGNFMGNKFHLLPVYKTENRSKSDRGPEEYMPPNRAYRCQYLVQWLKVKLIWDLELTPPEKESVQSLVKSENCSLQDFVFAKSDLEQQRTFITDNMDLCH